MGHLDELVRLQFQHGIVDHNPAAGEKKPKVAQTRLPGPNRGRIQRPQAGVNWSRGRVNSLPPEPPCQGTYRVCPDTRLNGVTARTGPQA